VLKTVVLLHISVGTVIRVIIIQDSLMNYLIEIKIVCHIINVPFDQLNASLLDKSINS